MRDTSIEAYRNLLSSGDLSRQLNEAYQVIYKQGPVTGQELTKIMEEDGKWKLLAPLKHMGLVEEISKRKCLITGRVVYEWDITGKFEIPEEQVEVIYNPIDNDKFKPKPTVKTENSVLFVGTIDYLRKEAILDLMERTKEEGKELWLVGEDKSNYLQQVLVEPHVKHFPPTWAVENFIYRCEETAGIQLGRTTIEGWMCGKPSWIYKVDSGGFILSKEKFDPPTDIEKYYASNVAKQIKEEYLKNL